MEHALYRLAYFSHNAISPVDRDLEAEIGKILTTARERNRSAGVTGALLYSNGCFGQVLEGRQAQVEAIFESILQDERHRDIQIVHLEPAESRSFGDWSMAFAGLPAAGQVTLDVEGLLKSPEAIQGGQAGMELVQVLHAMIGRCQQHTGASLSA